MSEPLPPGEHTISCQNCGNPSTVYPLSSEYVETRLEPCPRGDVKGAFFDCDNCDKRNHFYWHKKHGDDRFTPSVE
ncbi:MAG: hypothetical protein WBZ36_23660 [Candidatus Nitrosopolaris sp.]